MRKQKSCKPLLYLLLTGWCLLFLRCESTEKSMVRAVYLSQTGQGYQAGLLYQAPQAAADAAEASAALQFVQAKGQTMEQALAGAEQALPQTASYRLCDYLLLSKAEEPLLTEYEQLVLRRGCGRTAARLLCAEGETDHLATRVALPDALMAQIKAAAPTAPRLYEHTEPGLLPVLGWNAEEVTIQEGGVLHTVAANTPLSPEQTEIFRLLAGQGGIRQLWLEGERIGIRRCTVSVTLQKAQVLVRLDCQRAAHSPLPTQARQQQLAEQCTALLQGCWQQGVDVLHLQARAALRSGSIAGFDPTKNACPQWRTDVHFMLY
jgi:hypothetical protein